MNSGKCPCCDAELPIGVKTCPNCLIHIGKPDPKYAPGTWVKYKVRDQYTYNVVVDSYFNDSDGLHMHLYRLNELMMLPVWREDWLEPVSEEELQWLVAAQEVGKLKWHRAGGCYVEEATADV